MKKPLHLHLSRPNRQGGFTLVEMMTAMTIGLIIIAGVVGIFISQNKVQNSDRQRSELLADLQVVSQIIRSELHFAQGVCTANNGTEILYQPLDSTVALPATCDTVNAANGEFKLKSAANCSSSTPCLCWNRPNADDGCQELMRNIKATTGLQASVDSYGVYQIDIYGQYLGVDHNTLDLATRLTIWPRN
ncbi:MAG: prepilin-type N-terminal cleavage/methylation domain-containing protein [Mariprofundales bacterium]